MGIYDRDYTQANSPFGRSKRIGNFLIPAPGWLSMVAILIIINVAVFVVDSILFKFAHIGANFNNYSSQLLFYWGHFSASLGFGHFQIWRLLSFQFLHASVGHLFWNMLGLFFFGPMVEQYLGSKRFVAYYLLCGMAGAVFYMLMMMLNIVNSSGTAPLIGASAGIFGVLVAAARIAPNTQVLFMFIIPIKLRTMIWFAIGLAALTLVSKGNNAGGEAAHLGGAALGFWIISKPSMLNFAERFGKRNGPSLIQRAQQRKQQRAEQSVAQLNAEVDRILDKVKNAGLQSLTDKEKRILQKATHQQRRG